LKIIGVTGPIGSGKSTFSKIFAKRGYDVIDADVVYREVIEKGQPALDEIKEFFGNEVIDKNDELDRKRLGDIVFSSKEKLDELNKITHKYIIKKIKEKIEILKDVQSLIVLECPIPLREGFCDVADTIVVVTASIDLRIERIMKRNNISHSEALNRINSQMKEDEYIKIAHHVIYNDSDEIELERKVDDFIQRI